jgi:hypothetical protein
MRHELRFTELTSVNNENSLAERGSNAMAI